MKSIGLPRQLFWFSAAVSLLVPFLARLPSVPFRGPEWLTDYLPGPVGLLFVSAFNLIPAAALFGLGKASKRAPLAFWVSVAALLGFLLWAHGTINLRASSTAAIGLAFIPVYAVAAAVVGWLIGRVVHSLTTDDQRRFWFAAAAIGVAVVAGIATSIGESAPIAAREARFPVVSVKEVALVKREVYPCCAIGRVHVLALGNFDADDIREIAAFGDTGVVFLDPATYAVKSTTPFRHQDCDHCVHMHPYLVPDGQGGVLVATSDGLSDGQGRLLWANKARGFSRTVPVRTPENVMRFLTYHTTERIDFHDLDGKVLWSDTLPVQDVGAYANAAGEEMPSAVTCCGGGRELRVYDAAGAIAKRISLPEWASNVSAIAWPKPGHLLVGRGSHLGVLDPDGREVLRHVIRDTSFNPYHGPDGTAVRFRADEEPYLAVMSHGSSGYPRSVLLVFDPKGRLVWQEELPKLRAILAIPRPTGSGDVLLVGGMDGVIEYTLANASGPSLTLETTPKPAQVLR